MNDGDGRRKGPTAMTDGGYRWAMVKAKLTGVTNMELEETYGRLEATGGCDRWRLGLLAGGGSADVAGWVDGFNRKVVDDLLPKGAWRSRPTQTFGG